MLRLLVVILWLFAEAGIAQPTYRFGIVPWDKPENLARMYQPLMDAIEAGLKIKTEFSVTQNYGELKQFVQQKKIDFAFFTPKSYVAAKRLIPGLQYLVTHRTKDAEGNFKDYYTGYIISHRESAIRKLTDLKDKRFAFTDLESSSGFAYPASILREKGIDYKTYFSKIFWLKKHHRVTGAIAKKSVDAGATWDDNLFKSKREFGDVFRVILETPPIPNDPITASPHIDPSLAKKLQEFLASLNENSPVIKKMRVNGWPDFGFSKRNDQFYDVVRKLHY